MTLVVGARYACFYCRERAQRGGRCERCGRNRFELAGEAANSRLVQLARRVFKATVVHGTGAERDKTLAITAHVVAASSAVIAVVFTVQQLATTTSLAAKLALVALAAGLGYVGGYLSVGLFLLLVLLSTALLALIASTAIIAGAGALTAMTLLIPGPRAAKLREALARKSERAIAAVFEPVFRMRGTNGGRERWRRPRRHEGLRPTAISASPAPLQLAAGPSDALEGTLSRCPSEASMGEARGVIVGVAGYTVGARVEDAIVAPFVLETSDGPVHVEVSVGQVIFSREMGHERVVQELPTQWGIARSKRRPEGMPPNEPVALFSIGCGARVRIEGGERSERAAQSDREGYRDALFERAVKGTAKVPVKITVL